MPFRTKPERGFEGFGEDAFFFQMDITGRIAGASADTRPITVFDRRIIENLFDDLSCTLGRKIRFPGNHPSGDHRSPAGTYIAGNIESRTSGGLGRTEKGFAD